MNTINKALCFIIISLFVISACSREVKKETKEQKKKQEKVTCKDDEKVKLYLDNDDDGYTNEKKSKSFCPKDEKGKYKEKTKDNDCDDADKSIYPGADEKCGDNKDNNCNGDVDEDCRKEIEPEEPAEEDCIDSDGDGYGKNCEKGEDCNDTDPEINIKATEVCDDKIDNNCNGLVDADDPDCEEEEPECVDADLDGYTADSCGGKDCDDSDPNIHPGVDEDCTDLVDNDCDGDVNEDCPSEDLEVVNCDVDGDGFLAESCGGEDCDDSNPDINPGVEEICDDTIDNDCDLDIDDIDSECYVAKLDACPDADGDGHKDETCGGDDCDDGDPAINPDVEEICDGIDNNCNGLRLKVERDKDEDGYMVCERDCDDNNSAVNPSVPEKCDDGIDNNCDGQIDEGCKKEKEDIKECEDKDGDEYGVGDGCLEKDCDDDTTDDPEECKEEICANCADLKCTKCAKCINPKADEISFDGVDNDCDPDTSDTDEKVSLALPRASVCDLPAPIEEQLEVTESFPEINGIYASDMIDKLELSFDKEVKIDEECTKEHLKLRLIKDGKLVKTKSTVDFVTPYFGVEIDRKKGLELGEYDLEVCNIVTEGPNPGTIFHEDERCYRIHFGIALTINNAKPLIKVTKDNIPIIALAVEYMNLTPQVYEQKILLGKMGEQRDDFTHDWEFTEMEVDGDSINTLDFDMDIGNDGTIHLLINYAVWSEGGASNKMIYRQYISDFSTFEQKVLCEKDCAYARPSIVVDEYGAAHWVYVDFSKAELILWYNNSLAEDGPKEIDKITKKPEERGTLIYPSITMDDDNYPIIVYRKIDKKNSYLKMVRYNVDKDEKEEFVIDKVEGTDLGYRPFAFEDDEGRFNVVYVDKTNKTIKHAREKSYAWKLASIGSDYDSSVLTKLTNLSILDKWKALSFAAQFTGSPDKKVLGYYNDASNYVVNYFRESESIVIDDTIVERSSNANFDMYHFRYLHEVFFDVDRVVHRQIETGIWSVEKPDNIYLSEYLMREEGLIQ